MEEEVVVEEKGNDGALSPTGQLDTPLSAHGRWQSSMVGRRLATETITHVYTSDLARAVEVGGERERERESVCKKCFICFLECHQLHLSPKIRIPMESAQHGHGIAHGILHTVIFCFIYIYLLTCFITFLLFVMPRWACMEMNELINCIAIHDFN